MTICFEVKDAFWQFLIADNKQDELITMIAKTYQLMEQREIGTGDNFLKKIKSIHPALTSNDLRLCAYLRLNLSSKEIAPLLNISPRSVEVKRYRLRKKMDLPHEANLSDYILEI
jgi:DNA-binding CsgD family transcriptional regulator